MSKLFASLSVLLLTFSLVVQPIRAHSIELSPDQFEAESQNFLSSLPLPSFEAGEDVTITEDVLGDLYVAGGTVTIRAKVYGDLLVAGGTVLIQAPVEQDIRAGGGTVQIEDHVGGNVTVGGGTVKFTEGSTVDGSVVAGGGEVHFHGSIGGHVFVGGETVMIDGPILGHVNGGASDLEVAGNAHVLGDLAVKVGNDFSVSESAIVEGRRDIRIVEDNERADHRQNSGWFENRASMMIWGMLSTLLGGALLIKLFSKPMATIAKTILTSPWSTLGWGAVILFLAPIVIILVMVTMIGLPLGFLLLMLYIIAIIVSSWITSFAVGRKLAETSKLEQLKNPYAQLAAGIVVLAFLKVLPFVGWLVGCVSLLFGLGALWQYRNVLWAVKKD